MNCMEKRGEFVKNDFISTEHIVLIVTAVILGTLSRILTIKEDYRQYPSYPNGYLIHLLTGFVAAALGAVSIPALMTKNFVAVTFFSFAGLDFPNDPLKIFPFLVFLSPLPMMLYLGVQVAKKLLDK